MKTFSKVMLFVVIVTAITIYSCKKEKTENPATTTTAESFSSLQDFFDHHGVQTQTYTVNAVTGGSFTSPQGTVVSIPANAFVTLGGAPISGSVTIGLKDIYKKSDMLLAQYTTVTTSEHLLKSGGEFFIKADQGGTPIFLAPSASITVTAPAALTGGVDTTMAAYSGDSLSSTSSWTPSPSYTLLTNATSYIYTFTSLMPPSGTQWLNTDSPISSSYASLTFHQTDSPSLYGTKIFLLMSSLNSSIQLGIDNAWFYAPVGYPATLVAVGVKDGKLYSSFVPVSITTATTINFSLTETTSSAFETQLDALN